MATLSLRLTTNGGKFKGRLVVECATRENGKTLKRHYKVVQGLQSPIYSPESWNEKEGLFISGPNAVQNNHVVKLLLDELQEFIDTGAYKDGRQLYDAYDYSKAHPEAAPSATFGEFLESVITKLKTEGRSSNIEQYTTLYHALTGVNILGRGIDIDAEGFTTAHPVGMWITDCRIEIEVERYASTRNSLLTKENFGACIHTRLIYKFDAKVGSVQIVDSDTRLRAIPTDSPP